MHDHAYERACLRRALDNALDGECCFALLRRWEGCGIGSRGGSALDCLEALRRHCTTTATILATNA
jgi:hypothetical protein